MHFRILFCGKVGKYLLNNIFANGREKNQIHWFGTTIPKIPTSMATVAVSLKCNIYNTHKVCFFSHDGDGDE